MGKTVSLEEAVALVMELPPLDKIRLIERIAPRLERDWITAPTHRRSLLGLWSDLGNAPSSDEIDQARREMWKNFPREDIA